MTLDHNNTKKPSEQELLKQLAELNNKIAQTSAASAISLPTFTLPPLSSLPSSSSTTSSTTARTSLSSATTPTFDDKSSTTTTTRTGITNNNKNNIHEKKRKRTIEDSKAIAIKNDGNNVNQPKKRMKFLPPQLLNKTTTATTTTTSSATSTTIKAQPTNSIQIQQLQKYDYHLLQQANLVKQRKSLEAAHTTTTSTTTTTGTPSTTTTTTTLLSQQQQQQQHSNKKHQLRSAAGETWEDNTLLDYPENDYRLFVGNLGNDVTDDVLAKSFSVFPSFTMARVIRDKKTLKSRGYGFVSMMDVNDYITALDKMNGKYIGSRPCEIKKSNWRDRSQHK